MQTLPLDVIPLIFGYILKTTDKRYFSRTCKQYNNLTRDIIKKIKKIEIPRDISQYYYHSSNKIEHFTYELYYDSYLDLIPIKHINPQNKIIVDLAIISGNVKILQIAINRGCIQYVTNYHSELAIKYGQLEIFKLLIKFGGVWSPKFADIAVIHGHLNILVYAKQNNFALDMTKTYNMTLRYGHLDIIKFCVDNGIRIDDNDCNIVVMYGHLDILIWLNSEGCELKKQMYIGAQNHGKRKIIEWLENNDCPK